MKIAIGCDPNATEYKKILTPFVEEMGHEVVDFGSDDPIYANTAIEVAKAVAAKEAKPVVKKATTAKKTTKK